MKRAGKALAWVVAVPIAMIVLFLIAAWVGSAIPRNAEWTEPSDGIDIMVETNGVHTAIVLPLVNAQKDWRRDFPATDIAAAGRPYTHVSISWGEREVFLNTPTWGDITLKTIVNAATGSSSLLHVAHYVRPAPSQDLRPMRITAAQYIRLVHAIERQVLPRAQRHAYSGYFDSDVFYDAPGTYHIGKTCNQWTSDVLAAAGVPIGRWTPLAGGVMRWIPEARD